MKRGVAVGVDLDPREPWEMEVDEDTARAQALTGIRGFPYCPRRAEDTPSGAAVALREAVGTGGLADLLVVPAQARPARSGRSRRQVLTLWVGPPARPGVQVAVSAREVAAIETVHILLYARLTILAPQTRLSIRYNAVAEHELQPLVRALRRRITGSAQDGLPYDVRPDSGLPYKWRRLLASDIARLDDGETVAAVAGPVPGPRRSEAAFGAVVLTARELVVLADPVQAERAGGRYGVDAHHIPRARIESLSAEGPLLRVQALGVDLRLPLGEDLSGRAAKLFAGYLPGTEGRGW